MFNLYKTNLNLSENEKKNTIRNYSIFPRSRLDHFWDFVRNMWVEMKLCGLQYSNLDKNHTLFFRTLRSKHACHLTTISANCVLINRLFFPWLPSKIYLTTKTKHNAIFYMLTHMRSAGKPWFRSLWKSVSITHI